ncbi:hypothetical protein FQZ97_705520 [compost metagenome]
MQLALAYSLAQVGHHRPVGNLHEGIVAVRQHQAVLAAFVGEEPEDAFLLQQPRDEGEIGFAVLHAVFARAVAAGELEHVVGEAVGLEDRGDDVAGGEVLEHPIIAGERQPPEPGTQHQLVALGGGVGGELVDLGDQGVQGALLVVVVQGGGEVRRNRAGQGEGGGAIALEGESAQCVQRLVTTQAFRVEVCKVGRRQEEAGGAICGTCHLAPPICRMRIGSGIIVTVGSGGY